MTFHRAFSAAARLTLDAVGKAGVRHRLKKLVAENGDGRRPKRVDDGVHSLPHLERRTDGRSMESVGAHPVTLAMVDQATASEMRANAWYDG
jgi:hypothetical protein